MLISGNEFFAAALKSVITILFHDIKELALWKKYRVAYLDAMAQDSLTAIRSRNLRQTFQRVANDLHKVG